MKTYFKKDRGDNCTMKYCRSLLLVLPFLVVSSVLAQELQPIFDGKTFEGWEGNT